MSLWQRRLFVAEKEIQKTNWPLLLHVAPPTPPPPPTYRAAPADPPPSPPHPPQPQPQPILSPFSFFPQTNRWLCSPEYANLLCTSNSLGEDHLLKA